MELLQVVEMMRTICAQYGIRSPQAIFRSSGVGYSTYFPSRELIKFQHTVTEDIVLHELAHHFEKVRPRLRAGGFSRAQYGFRRRRDVHGPSFRSRLHELATLWYGDARRYDWSKEYAQITSWAIRMGLLPDRAPVDSTANPVFIGDEVIFTDRMGVKYLGLVAAYTRSRKVRVELDNGATVRARGEWFKRTGNNRINKEQKA